MQDPHFIPPENYLPGSKENISFALDQYLVSQAKFFR